MSLSPFMGFILSTLCTYLTQNGLPGPGSPSSSSCSGLCLLESQFQRPKRNHIGQLMFSRTLPRLASLWLGSPSRCAPLVQQPRPEGRGTWWDPRAHCPLGWRELTGPRTRQAATLRTDPHTDVGSQDSNCLFRIVRIKQPRTCVLPSCSFPNYCLL